MPNSEAEADQCGRRRECRTFARNNQSTRVLCMLAGGAASAQACQPRRVLRGWTAHPGRSQNVNLADAGAAQPIESTRGRSHSRPGDSDVLVGGKMIASQVDVSCPEDRLFEADFGPSPDCPVRAGQGQLLVLRAEPGVGKTASLDYLMEGASGSRIARVACVESETKLALAGLQQLCAPFLDQIKGILDPQR